jgi:hypothetical protein
MSIFDGIGSIVAETFGAGATITRQATGVPVTVRAVFRFVMTDDPVADGRGLIQNTPVLRIPADAFFPLVRGDVVQPSDHPGRSFIVLQRDDSGSAGADRMITYICEET